MERHRSAGAGRRQGRALPRMRWRGLAALALLALEAAAQAGGSFISYGATTGTYSTLDALIGSLAPCTTAGYTLSLQGVPVLVSFEGQVVGTGAVVVNFPNQNVPAASATGDCGTLQAFLEKLFTTGPSGVAILRAQVANSAFSPIAGNPTSLLSRTALRDYDDAFLAYATNVVDGADAFTMALAANEEPGVRSDAAAPFEATSAGTAFRPAAGLGAEFSDIHAAGQTAQSVTLPFAVTYRSALDPRRQFSLLAPVTLTNVQGALAWSGSLGAAARLPLAAPWALSASARLGTTSSADLGASANLGSLSLTSSYLIRAGSADISVGNQAGYYHTLGRSLDGKSPDPHVGSFVTRNGLLVSTRAPSWLGSARSIEVSGYETRYCNPGLYSRAESEVGLALGTNKHADSVRSYFMGRVSYLFSPAAKGLTLGFGYWF